MNHLLIKRQEGQLVVSIGEIADDFGKEHKNVLQVMENILCEMSMAENPAVLSI